MGWTRTTFSWLWYEKQVFLNTQKKEYGVRTMNTPVLEPASYYIIRE